MNRICLIVLTMATFGVYAQKVDLQGHRGARGMRPENTVSAFIYALDQGVTTLELDVVITRDNKVVVSHEPWISTSICVDKNGEEILESQEKKLNIYQMTYKEVKSYDCGSKGNTRFSEQQKEKAYKPLLSKVIATAERHIKSYTQYEVDYNIEIKSNPNGDKIFHPEIEKFSDLVYELIDQYLPMERVVIQSFDFRVLQYWNRKYPEVRLAALVENTKSINKNLELLGFKPEIYSPNFRLLSKKKIEQLQAEDIKVIPWTVNDTTKMKELVEWNVDGIITDYPNRAKELGLALPLEANDKN